MEFKELYKKAQETLNYRVLSNFVDVSRVSAAILAENGQVYMGVSIDAACGTGFCAEHSAAACMITDGQNVMKKVVAVNKNGKIIPPCGRCREFMMQLSDKNADAEVMVDKDTVVSLSQLMPYDWRKKSI